MLNLCQAEELAVNLSLPASLYLLIIGCRAVWMSATHVTAEGLTMRENFATCLTHKFAITFLLDYFSLCHLSLLISLLHVLPDSPALDSCVLTGGSIRHGGVGGCFNLAT